MNRTFTLGTRGSKLALAQANLVKLELNKYDINVNIKIISTIGDLRTDLSLKNFWKDIDDSSKKNITAKKENELDKGIFTKNLEQFLLNKEIDFAVHSLKDVPTILEDDFEICATLDRENKSDVLLTTNEDIILDLENTNFSSKISLATSSVRRAFFLKNLYPSVTINEIRGNVNTRIDKLINGNCGDGIILARAGLERLGFISNGDKKFEFNGEKIFVKEFDTLKFLPAVGQGALGIEVCKDNLEIKDILNKINNDLVFKQITAEREFLACLQAGCQTPVGVNTWFESNNKILVMKACVFDELNLSNEPFIGEVKGESNNSKELAIKLLELKNKHFK